MWQEIELLNTHRRLEPDEEQGRPATLPFSFSYNVHLTKRDLGNLATVCRASS